MSAPVRLRPIPCLLAACLLLATGSALVLPAAQASPIVTNGGFETGTINWNGAWGAYCYSSPACTASGWSGSYLLTSTGSWAWGWPGARPGFDATSQGVVVAGLQATEHVEQTLHIGAAGRYTLAWLDAGRPSSGFTYYAQDYEVSPGGVLLGNFHTEAGQAWASHGLMLDLAAGDALLSFRGLHASDSTTFLDNVTLTALAAPAAPASPAGTVPEPQSLALVALGLLSMGGLRRGRAQRTP